MSKIFISYRREDSTNITERIYDRLVDNYGEKNIFIDKDNIPYGSDFSKVIEKAIDHCDVMLVIIGDIWSTVTDDNGNFRLQNKDDFVRIELEIGFRQGIPIIPILVNNATMPKESLLPKSLHKILFNNALSIGNNPYFKKDVLRLFFTLNNILAKKKRWKIYIVVVFVVALVSVSIYYINKKNNILIVSNTEQGAVIGGLLGAVIDGTTANRSKERVPIGSAIGAVVGAAIGYSLDQQAAEVAQRLKTQVNNSATAEQNSNNQLIVSNTDKFVKIMFRNPMMFKSNSAIPTPNAEMEIREMIPILKKNSYANMIIQIVGHTDGRGSFQHNQTLSEERASLVGEIFKSARVHNPIYSKGCSFSKPIVQNTSDSNMALNRRVEVYLYPNKESVIDPCLYRRN